jgi:hypothetical protein
MRLKEVSRGVNGAMGAFPFRYREISGRALGAFAGIQVRRRKRVVARSGSNAVMSNGRPSHSRITP